MHARVTTVRAKPGKLDEAIGVARDSVAEVARTQKGFGGMTLLSDPETGKAIVITMWESEADMEANEASGYYREQIGKIADFIAEAPVRETYEVSFQT